MGFFLNFSIFFILHTFGRFLQLAALSSLYKSTRERGDSKGLVWETEDPSDGLFHAIVGSLSYRKQ